ncbi:MAG: hypothetical protein AAF704_11320 [Cyanobacteria bacterium P01_D01_bin.123]
MVTRTANDDGAETENIGISKRDWAIAFCGQHDKDCYSRGQSPERLRG